MRCPGAGGEQVSYGIDGSDEAEGLETLAEPDGTSLLGKGRRRNGGDGELEVGNVPLMAGKPLEETVDARVGSEAREILDERSGLSTLGLRSCPGTEWHFRNDGKERGAWKWVAGNPSFANGGGLARGSYNPPYLLRKGEEGL